MQSDADYVSGKLASSAAHTVHVANKKEAGRLRKEVQRRNQKAAKLAAVPQAAPPPPAAQIIASITFPAPPPESSSSQPSLLSSRSSSLRSSRFPSASTSGAATPALPTSSNLHSSLDLLGAVASLAQLPFHQQAKLNPFDDLPQPLPHPRPISLSRAKSGIPFQILMSELWRRMRR